MQKNPEFRLAAALRRVVGVMRTNDVICYERLMGIKGISLSMPDITDLYMPNPKLLLNSFNPKVVSPCPRMNC